MGIVLFALTWCQAGAEAPGKERAMIERPIIAGVVAEPQHFLGRRIELYGVVVKTTGNGRRFYIQDVSQRPLLVVAPAGKSARLYEQYVVTGVLRWLDGELGLAAERLAPARVTAGGGCC